ncbi:putative tricarboxylic transport membrane protein [Lipingzhangella halophila]|uniref:Putative tricarboxylic transport membrane protein n=1 Tax=Lipingzhangella halophila TaxID=1783352 RepID=A0A7W7W2P4_9ACTN|nr:tripartite tricarboxylate transporter permease [Lipingzhangella halophila]MBB4930900.1 putative tricarboxylic transport membrane protein [Lipingzhangella halophila]
MNIAEFLRLGFEVAFQPSNILYVFLGVLIGMVIGVLPGLGASATIALLLPVTYGMEPESAIIMLAGIYYGSIYGGTITAVLVQLPGEANSAITLLDGYPMARQGRAGPALGIAAIGSFLGGTLAIVGLSLFAPLLAQVAVNFGPPEYTVLTVLGILLVTYLGTNSVTKSLIMAALGLFLATVGQDPITGTSRFTFGSLGLLDGLSFVAIAMGVFGVGEILYNLERRVRGGDTGVAVSRVLPTMADWLQSRWAIARGAVIGFLIGILPGGGGVLSSMASYTAEKKLARDPQRFGRGAIEGVAGPETANNAGATSAFIPLLTLGIPTNAVTALLFGALLIQGITPSPQLIEDQPELFTGVISSMYLGNLFLLLMSIPLIGVFIQILRIRMTILGPLAVMVTMVGVYSLDNDSFNMWVVLCFGVLGYVMRKTGFPPGPLVLAFVLGPIMETSFRQSLLISEGSLAIFVTRPGSASVLAFGALVIAATAIQYIRKKRRANVTTGA